MRYIKVTEKLHKLLKSYDLRNRVDYSHFLQQLENWATEENTTLSEILYDNGISELTDLTDIAHNRLTYSKDL